MNENIYGDYEQHLGKEITKAVFDSEFIILHFSDGTGIKISDTAHGCCERRYFTADDNIEDLVGNTLTSIQALKYITKSFDETHEICFLEIRAESEIFAIASHNEHNGYYGGMSITVEKTYERH